VQQAWLQDIEARQPLGAIAGSGAAAATSRPAAAAATAVTTASLALPSCCFFTFANTRQSLTSAAFTHNAALVAAGFADSSVRLYDVAKMAAAATKERGSGGGVSGRAGNQRATTPAGDADDDPLAPGPGMTFLYGHSAAVHALDFSVDLRLLLSASADGCVRLWSADLGTGLAAFRGHLLPVWDVSAAPHGYHFATASADRTCRVWSTDTLKPLRVLAGAMGLHGAEGLHRLAQYVMRQQSTARRTC
jgi:transcription initiation factor TFIID subunit 5